MSEINELSPETYASYIKKASADMAAKAEGPSSMRTPKKIRQDADLAAKDKKTLPLGRDGAEQRKRHDLLTRHAVARRKKGIENATDRLVAKTKAAASPSADVKVKNPDTGEEILATTAYKAGPTHPAYKAAKSALKKESTGIIKLTDIILENYIDEYSDEEKQKMGIPSGATSRGGVWYVGDKYAGKVVNGKFVAAGKEQPAKSAPAAKGNASTPTSQTDRIAAQRRASAVEKLPITPKVSKKMGSILDKHIKALEKEREEEIKVFPKEKEWYDTRIAQFEKISELIKQGNVEDAFNEWNKMETQDTDDTIHTALQPVITWMETHMGDYLLGTTGSARNDRELRANAERWGFQRSPHVERSRKRMGIKVKEPRPKWN